MEPDAAQHDLLAVRDGAVREGDLLGIVVALNFSRQCEQPAPVLAQDVDRLLLGIDRDRTKRLPQDAETTDVIGVGVREEDGEDRLARRCMACTATRASGIVRNPSMTTRPSAVSTQCRLTDPGLGEA